LFYVSKLVISTFLPVRRDLQDFSLRGYTNHRQQGNIIYGVTKAPWITVSQNVSLYSYTTLWSICHLLTRSLIAQFFCATSIRQLASCVLTGGQLHVFKIHSSDIDFILPVVLSISNMCFYFNQKTCFS